MSMMSATAMQVDDHKQDSTNNAAILIEGEARHEVINEDNADYKHNTEELNSPSQYDLVVGKHPTRGDFGFKSEYLIHFNGISDLFLGYDDFGERRVLATICDGATTNRHRQIELLRREGILDNIVHALSVAAEESFINNENTPSALGTIYNELPIEQQFTAMRKDLESMEYSRIASRDWNARAIRDWRQERDEWNAINAKLRKEKDALISANNALEKIIHQTNIDKNLLSKDLQFAKGKLFLSFLNASWFCMYCTVAIFLHI